MAGEGAGSGIDSTSSYAARGRSLRGAVLAWATSATLILLALSAQPVLAQCPDSADDAFAFLPVNPSQGRCPATPEVRWAEPRVPFECGFLAESSRMVDCGEPSAAGCVAACGEAAAAWNAALGGRFSFVPADATTPVGFCDPDDHRTSVGGSDSFCDGTEFPANVVAVTLRFTAGDGTQIDADITVNQAFDFTRDQLASTLAHEFGHVLGLDHPNQCNRPGNVLMRSASLFAPDSQCFARAPVLADVNGARTIYPAVGPTPQPICGDADGSGVIIEADAVQALRAAAELSNDCMSGTCDVDGNGVVTVTDGVSILRAARGLPLNGSCGR